MAHWCLCQPAKFPLCGCYMFHNLALAYVIKLNSLPFLSMFSLYQIDVLDHCPCIMFLHFYFLAMTCAVTTIKFKSYSLFKIQLQFYLPYGTFFDAVSKDPFWITTTHNLVLNCSVVQYVICLPKLDCNSELVYLRLYLSLHNFAQ